KRKPKKAVAKPAVSRRTKPGPKRKPREKAVDKDKEHADKAAATKKAADEQARKAADEQDAALDKAAAKDTVTPTVAAPEDMMTEQEKDTSAGVHGVGPVV